MKFCIYSGFSDQRIEIVKNLYKNLDFIPKINLADKRDFENYTKTYENIFNLDAFSLRFGNFDYSKIKKKIPVDRKILDILSTHQYTALNLLQDSNNYSYTLEQRFNFYFDSLCFWNSIIKENKIDYFISWTWPHNIIDYTLYLLCKYIYKIETIFIDDIPVLNISAICSDLDNLSKNYLLANNLESQKENIQLEKFNTSKYLNELKKVDTFSYTKEILSTLLILPKFYKKEISGFKIGKENINHNSSRMNLLQNKIFRIRSMINNFFIFKYIQKISVTPDFNNKFILFASNYQPEATSSVTSSYYQNQIVALEILSSSLPKNWKIYYREYPKKILFHWHLLYLKRPKQYFNRLNSIKNLIITDYNFNLEKLINQSQAVATISSNVGFEGLKLNKPVILFGSSWYEKFKGVYKVITLNECVNALKNIEKGIEYEFIKNSEYIKNIIANNKLFIHRNYHSNIKGKNISEEMNLIASKIIEYINSFK